MAQVLGNIMRVLEAAGIDDAYCVLGHIYGPGGFAIVLCPDLVRVELVDSCPWHHQHRRYHRTSYT